MSLLAIMMLSGLTEIPPPPKGYYDCPTGQAVFTDSRVSVSEFATGDYEIRLYTQPHCFFEGDGPVKTHVSNVTGVRVFRAGK
ncbi:MAG TPA: hypothetical protein VGH71_01325, partial [Gammaproteobacteria bacterium]